MNVSSSYKVKKLEKNCLNVCDPQIDNYVSPYEKMNYKVPSEITPVTTGNAQNYSKWSNILEKITLANIHLENDETRGK